MLSKNHLGKISIASVKQYLRLAEALRLPVDEIINLQGLEGIDFSDNSQYMKGELFQSFLLALIKTSDDPLFGLHSANYVEPGSYNVLGFISMNCRTLGDAINKIQPFEKLVGDMGTTTIGRDQDLVKISWHCIYTDIEAHQQLVDNCLASWVNFAQDLIDESYHPSRVELSRSTPSMKQQLQYHQVFGCEVFFNQSSDSLLFDPGYLQLPLNKGTEQILKALEIHAKELLKQFDQNRPAIVQSTYQLIDSKLSAEKINIHQIASELNMTTKTLQRNLKRNNKTFQGLLDEIRLNKAYSLLRQKKSNLEQISEQIGFNNPRSFYRWFHKQTRKTPGSFRLNTQ